MCKQTSINNISINNEINIGQIGGAQNQPNQQGNLCGIAAKKCGAPTESPAANGAPNAVQGPGAAQDSMGKEMQQLKDLLGKAMQMIQELMSKMDGANGGGQQGAAKGPDGVGGAGAGQQPGGAADPGQQAAGGAADPGQAGQAGGADKSGGGLGSILDFISKLLDLLKELLPQLQQLLQGGNGQAQQPAEAAAAA